MTVPNREVHLRRWQVAAAFIALVVASALVITWEDGRIDKNARGVARAEARATAAQKVNRLQLQTRKELVAEARRADKQLCTEIEAIKERIRATVRVNTREEYEIILRRINPGIAEGQVTALYNQAKAQEQEVQERFAARDCATVPGG